MRKSAINNMINPLSADNINALCTGLPNALISGAFKALAIIMAAIEAGLRIKFDWCRTRHTVSVQNAGI